MQFTSLDEVIRARTEIDAPFEQHDKFEWLKQTVSEMDQALDDFWFYKLGEFV